MTTAPGKLVIAGEFAILAPGGLGLVLAVGPGITATARPPSESGRPLEARTVRLTLTSLEANPLRCHWNGLRLIPDRPSAAASFALAALETLAAELGPFSLELKVSGAGWDRDLPAGTPKPGLGGSASATVAILMGAARALGVRLTSERLHTLAHTAHRWAQGGAGSGIDVAASSWGGALLVQNEGSLEAPQLRITPLQWPWSDAPRVVHTGVSSRTVPRVERVLQWFRQQPEDATAWIEASNQRVLELVDALKAQHYQAFVAGIDACRQGLITLGAQTGLVMEGPELEQLGRLVVPLAAFKQTGAGGGDSGLVFVRHPSDDARVCEQIRGAGFRVLPLELAPPGPAEELQNGL